MKVVSYLFVCYTLHVCLTSSVLKSSSLVRSLSNVVYTKTREKRNADQCIDHCANCTASDGTCITCHPGYYGASCQNECTNCFCDVNGTCVSCSDGRYGSQCDLACPNTMHCTNDQCVMQDTLVCLSGCQAGWYGPQCNNSCSFCEDSMCDNNGNCARCSDGFWGHQCDSKCGDNCLRCSIGDRNCLKCNESYGIQGDGINCHYKCSNPNCAMCFRTSQSELCISCKSKFSGKQCLFTFQDDYCINRRENSVYIGLEGECECEDGRFGYLCENTCPGNCKACFDSNNCKACKDGYYGANCDQPCPVGCTSCSRDGRVCLACASVNHYGDYCQCKYDECSLRREGECYQCKNETWSVAGPGCCECGGHCKNGCQGVSELNTTSTCKDGCLDDFCGLDCSHKCCEHCNVTLSGQGTGCDANGTCSNGCQTDWYGPGCEFQCSKQFPHCQACQIKEKVHICESCEVNYFLTGNKCEPCIQCRNQRCDQTGVCLEGCTEGYFSSHLDYRRCERKCSFGCQGRDCNQTTGQCDCIDGIYGDKCLDQCPKNCPNKTCDKMTGHCLSCPEGLTGSGCQYPCSPNCRDGCYQNSTCRSCRPGTYGYHCERDCLNCLQQICSYTEDCQGPCQPGKYSDNCESPCHSSCFSCDKSTGTCFLCNSGYKLYNFDAYTCKQCDSMEECSNPYSMVSNVSLCTMGKYGLQCDKLCNPNCRQGNNASLGGGHCDVLTGGCTDGCIDGYHGVSCDIQCGHCHVESGSTVCERFGSCEKGCMLGYFGDKCDKTCSEFCASKNCSQLLGFCEGSCVTGYHGKTCELEDLNLQGLGAGAIAAIVVSGVVGTVMMVVLGILVFKSWRSIHSPSGLAHVSYSKGENGIKS